MIFSSLLRPPLSYNPLLEVVVSEYLLKGTSYLTILEFQVVSRVDEPDDAFCGAPPYLLSGPSSVRTGAGVPR